jgi:hypothetical protein
MLQNSRPPPSRLLSLSASLSLSISILFSLQHLFYRACLDDFLCLPTASTASMALDACIQTEFGEEQFEVCRFEEEEQQQQIPDVFSLSLSLSLSLSFFFFWVFFLLQTWLQNIMELF